MANVQNVFLDCCGFLQIAMISALQDSCTQSQHISTVLLGESFLSHTPCGISKNDGRKSIEWELKTPVSLLISIYFCSISIDTQVILYMEIYLLGGGHRHMM